MSETIRCKGTDRARGGRTSGPPAVAIPNGALPNGIPMGVTLPAPGWSDRTLIAPARRLDTKSRKQPHAP